MVNPSLLIAIPLAGAFLIPLFALASRRLSRYLPPLVLLADLTISLSLVPRVLEDPIIVILGGFKPPFCINLMVDMLGLSFAIIISLVSFLISIYAIGYIKTEPIEKYHALFLLLVAGAIGIVLTGDIFNLFVFFEILCISSYALTAYEKDKAGTEAAMKYLIQGAVGSAFILVAVAFIYGLFGTLNMAEIASNIDSAEPTHLFMILALFVVGFGIEAAIFPLNAWLPDAHSSAPSSISAILSGIAIKTGVYCLARISYTLMNAQELLILISLIGVVTLLVGEIAAYGQKEDIKRMLAYSSIGQVGLIVFALGVTTYLGIFGALFQVANHALAKSLLFLGTGYMIYNVGSNRLEAMEGLGRKMPFTAIAFTIAVFSLVGLPPFAGFVSKLSIIYAAVQTGQAVFIVFVALVLLATVIEAGYFFRIVQSLYFRKGVSLEYAKEAPMTALIPIAILALLIIAIGVYPQLITGALEGAARSLLERGAYISSVLGPM